MKTRHALPCLGAALLLSGCSIPFGPWSAPPAAAPAAASAARPAPGLPEALPYASLQGVDWVVDDPAFTRSDGGRLPAMRFLDEGRVSGTGGCNRYTGPAAFTAGGVRIGPLAATRLACLEPVMDLESRFFAAVEAVRGARLEAGRLRIELGP